MKLKKLFANIIRRLFRWFLWAFLLANIYLVVCKWMMPPITLTQIGSIIGGYGLKRDYVAYDKIAPSAKLAAMASEDQLFPDHGGFDWKSIEKSFSSKKGKHKKIAGAGASTITQQVAKNVFLWQSSGIGRYLRKIPEAYFTKMIEWVWGKQRILEVYLNIAEMGEGIFGIEAAAEQYFGKPAAKLSQKEAAMIIACLPNPKRFTVNPMSRRVAWRYPQILVQMENIAEDDDVQHLIKPSEDKQ